MRRVIHFTLAVGLITAGISVFWSYRVRAAEEAAQFAPASNYSVLLPARTAIQAVLRNGIVASSAAGDAITAFVSTPVVFDGRLVIPDGAQLNGELEKLFVLGPRGKASMSFNVLIIRGRSFAIQTQRVVVITPLESDIEILGTAFDTLMHATLGAALGAASGDARLINRGLLEGTKASMSADTTLPITVILVGDMEVEHRS